MQNVFKHGFRRTVAMILVLLMLIFSMIHFVITDMSRNFSLFQTNF